MVRVDGSSRSTCGAPAVGAMAALRRRRPAGHALQNVERLRLRTLVLLGGLAVGTAYLGRTFGLQDPIYLTSEVTLLLAILIVTHTVLPLLHRHEQGARGEQEVGVLLEGLRDKGYEVLHDLDLGRGNIDHLLIGPTGIFTVETKSHPGPIAVRRIHGAVLDQVLAQQQLVERITGEEVTPLLVYSRAWVDRPFARRRGVTVVPARMVEQLLTRGDRVLSPAEVARAKGRVLRVEQASRSSLRRRRLRDRSLFLPPGIGPRHG